MAVRQVVIPDADEVMLYVFLSGLAHMGVDSDIEGLLGLIANTALPLLPNMQPRVRHRV